MIYDLSKVDIKYLPGVGPKRAELLKAEAGLSSFGDLLYYFPYKYVDRTAAASIASARSTGLCLTSSSKDAYSVSRHWARGAGGVSWPTSPMAPA